MALIKFPNRTVNTDGVNPFVNSVFDNLFNDSFISDRLVTRVPAVNITESEVAFTIELAAPGLQKEDFKINVDKNIISISAEKVEDKEMEGSEKLYNKKEFNYNSFSRSFTLPETVDYSNIDAAYADGILKVKIGKKEDAIIAKRSIEVR
ncbi:Hsp20/alpha crystallin family protein [Sphingobacterium sp. Mn56C]|uniref:Hsp20/alpha crystallin family protein n=1 Tax=Sphingobacterium sp. Mn56C TaxID=3395261 RepID=UPI003BE9A512